MPARPIDCSPTGRGPGRTASAKKHREDLESVIRLARMDLGELQGLDLPKQCSNCKSGQCKKPGKKPGKGSSQGRGEERCPQGRLGPAAGQFGLVSGTATTLPAPSVLPCTHTEGLYLPCTFAIVLAPFALHHGLSLAVRRARRDLPESRRGRRPRPRRRCNLARSGLCAILTARMSGQASANSTAEAKKQEHLQKIRQLTFDRRPSAILKAWSTPREEAMKQAGNIRERSRSTGPRPVDSGPACPSPSGATAGHGRRRDPGWVTMPAGQPARPSPILSTWS